MVALGLLLTLLFALTLDGEHPIAQSERNVLFFQSRQIGLDRELPVVLAHIKLRNHAAPAARKEAWQARPVVLEALEHAVHLAAHGGEEIERAGQGPVFWPGDFGFCHGSLLSSGCLPLSFGACAALSQRRRVWPKKWERAHRGAILGPGCGQGR